MCSNGVQASMLRLLAVRHWATGLQLVLNLHPTSARAYKTVLPYCRLLRHAWQQACSGEWPHCDAWVCHASHPSLLHSQGVGQVITGCTSQPVRHLMSECTYVDFLHHIYTDLYRMVVHSVIIRFANLIRANIVDALLSVDSTVLGDHCMLLCSDVLCA